MKTLTVAALFVMLGTYAHARGPAVEDFVGIEQEQADMTPAGTEVLFNFQKDIQTAQKDSQTAEVPNHVVVNEVGNRSNIPSDVPWGSLVGIFTVLSLPCITWLLIMRHLDKQKAEELYNNVMVLDKYRHNKDQSGEEQKDDDIRKAS